MKNEKNIYSLIRFNVGRLSKSSIATNNKPDEKGDLILKEWKYLFWNGDTSKKGYYFLKDEEEKSYISYYDYASKQEVYLCNKPECQHKDETCTAYLESGSSMMNQILVYGDHLYMIETMGFGMNALGEREQKGPGIVQMDLDGQNRKELCRLDDGYEFELNNLIFADDELYIPVTKTQNVEVNLNETMQVTTDKNLCSINLKTGDITKVFDMKYKNILGGEGRQLIMSTMSYSEDPQKYLDEKNYKKYDKLMMNAKVNYEIYNIDTKESKTVQVNHQEIGNYYQNKIYYIEKNQLYILDLETEKISHIIDLPKGSTYNFSMIINDYAIIEQWKDKFIDTYKISLENPKLEKLNQSTRAPKEFVQILAQTKDQLLVVYDREGKEEKTWAGTMQYETQKEYVGLISKDDFLNNKKNYEPIKTLTKKRRA